MADRNVTSLIQDDISLDAAFEGIEFGINLDRTRVASIQNSYVVSAPLTPETQQRIVSALANAPLPANDVGTSSTISGMLSDAGARLGSTPEQIALNTRITLGVGAEGSRDYHGTQDTHGHFFDVTSNGANAVPILVMRGGLDSTTAQRMADIGAVFGAGHDWAYLGPDQGLHPEVAALVDKYIEPSPTKPNTYRIRPELADNMPENLRITQTIFNMARNAETGDIELGHMGGGNEFISNLAVLEVNDHLSVTDKVAGTVMVAETIPFEGRNSVANRMDRAALVEGFDPNMRDAVGMAAANFANGDVQNFGYRREGPDVVAGVNDHDRDAFIKNTIGLMHENGADPNVTDLNHPNHLAKRAGGQVFFFENILMPKIKSGEAVIFRSYNGVPPQVEVDEMNRIAVQQIENSIVDIKALQAAAIARDGGELTDTQRGMLEHGNKVLAEATGMIEETRAVRAQRVAAAEAEMPNRAANDKEPVRQSAATDEVTQRRSGQEAEGSARRTTAAREDAKPAPGVDKPTIVGHEGQDHLIGSAGTDTIIGGGGDGPSGPRAKPSLGARVDRVTNALNGAAAVKAFSEGDYAGAAKYMGNVAANVVTNKAMDVLQSSATWEIAGEVVEKYGARGVAAGIKAVGGKVPVVGAVVGLGFGLVDVGSEVYKAAKGESNWTKVATTTASALAGTVGGLIGFGAGEALQEGVRVGSVALVGKENASRHSATAELAIMAGDMVGNGAGTRASDKVDEEIEKGARKAFEAVRDNPVARGAGMLTASLMVPGGLATVATVATVMNKESIEQLQTKIPEMVNVAKDAIGKAGAFLGLAEDKTPPKPAGPVRFTISENTMNELERAGWTKGMDGARILSNGQVDHKGKKDGGIDLDEIRAVFKQYNVKAADVDKNGDGIATAGEISNAINAKMRQGQGAGRG